ncbi:MAG: ATP-binding cassette domain-containing protein [Desulfobacula sp.]|nr:ATP-binding cassette domain-containing protein [Desulfobacula sp.]
MTKTETKNNEYIKYRGIFLNRNSKSIFSDLNLDIFKNEKLLISGKSGTGKTTLFKLLLGFEQPDKGCVLCFGKPICKENIPQIRQQIFYLSQDIDLKNTGTSQLLDEILAANNIEQQGAYKLNDLLSFLELDSSILNQEIKELSGGERQRIGLLICFLLDRPIWLLDEPTSALDDVMKQKIADYILDQDKTIIIVSHDEVWKNDKRLTTKRMG